MVGEARGWKQAVRERVECVACTKRSSSRKSRGKAPVRTTREADWIGVSRGERTAELIERASIQARVCLVARHPCQTRRLPREALG